MQLFFCHKCCDFYSSNEAHFQFLVEKTLTLLFRSSQSQLKWYATLEKYSTVLL